MTGRQHAIRVGPRSAVTIAMASFLGLVAFTWPFVVPPGTFASTETPPLMFGVLLVLVLAVVFAGIADGGLDAKALAALGVLAAINAALRPLGAGTAGIETVFFLLVLAGRVFGPGFGFALGCTSLFASALLTGGVGPWLPYQMFGCAWVGMLAGLLPRVRGQAEIAMLAGFGAVSSYLFGFLLNLSFWPFSLDPASSIAYQPGLSFVTQWHRYLLFDASTSLGWDTGRAVTTVLAILIAGPAALAAFRRAARRANFTPAVTFTGPPGSITIGEAPSAAAGLAFVELAGIAPADEGGKRDGAMPAKSSQTQSGGFTAAERAAMKQRAEELRAEGKQGAKKADGLQALLDAIAKMAPEDRVIAERIHATVTATAPELLPKTWYGMPAYTTAEGKVVVSFKNSGKFGTRYSTLEFQDAANLDDGDIWPVSYALQVWSPAVEQKVVELVRAAVS